MRSLQPSRSRTWCAGAAALPMLVGLAAAQSPIPELRDLLSVWRPAGRDGAQAGRIGTRDEWEARRRDIITRTLDIMGEFPTANPPLDAKTESRPAAEGYA